MSILVTGATGRLGQRIVARLLAEGHEVRILTRRPFRAEVLFGARVDALEWHPGCDAAPDAAMAGIESLIHLAGEPLAGPASVERRQRMHTSRVKAAGRLLAAIGSRQVRLVAVSVAVPSSATGDVMTEATPRAAPRSDVERNGLDWDAACSALTGHGASVVIVRLGLLLEPNATLAALARMSAFGVLPALAGAQIPVIDPEDAAAMLTGLAMRRDLTGPLFGVAPEPLLGEDLVAGLARFGHLPFKLPLPAGLAERRLGPLMALLQSRTRIVPQRLIDAGAGFLHPDPKASLTRALDEMVAQRAPKRWLPGRSVAPTAAR